MNEEEIRKTLKSLREDAVDNPEEGFNNYILTDYNEAGLKDINYLIEDEDRYNYFLLLEFDILRVLDETTSIEDDSTRDALLLEIIDVKKVIDHQLLSLKDSGTIYQHLGITNPKPERVIEINSAICKQDTPKLLWQGLSGLGLIDTDLNSFSAHFEKSQTSDIRLKILNEEILIGPNNRSVEDIATTHFSDRNHKDLNKSSLKSQKYDLGSSKKDFSRLKDLINSVKKIN